MRALEIAICDDNVQVIKKVSEISKKYLFEKEINCNITEFQNGYNLLKSKKKYDIIFLDVEMPQIDGFEVATILRNKDEKAEIIYLTNHEEFAREAYKIRALRYILKSCMNEELVEGLEAAISELSKNKIVMLDNGVKCMAVDITDIFFIEALGDETNIYIKNKNEIFRRSLKYWEEYFDDLLFRCHRSFLVNFASVIEINGTFFILKNGIKIPISIRKLPKAKEAFRKYIKEHARIF
ncbi:LytR/AlgR family response regulator transcription factor [Candidatus Galacturonibacter soehngenii]|uniref:Stage 0 sporulation protein A homolog n=1 Tax=Candidatus Galacturonatibacter soehngenii TaxID=2307010 RepID=A0A7V7UAH4_9FIRM|nr:LytTR family DNA-binding domain-containing protein [Candidatus Galacturonibacter soehngenii]KAB1435771.1 response regulator transcription factor [Candidatus Galacturonibacter soehngenii]